MVVDGIFALGGVVGGETFGTGVEGGRGKTDVTRDGVGLSGGMSGNGL